VVAVLFTSARNQFSLIQATVNFIKIQHKLQAALSILEANPPIKIHLIVFFNKIWLKLQVELLFYL
jgi:hypothetical protein